MDDLWKWLIGVFAALWGVVSTMLGWIINRQVARIDRLEREKANRTSTNERFDRVFARIEKHQDENREIQGKILQELSTVNSNLANIEGRLSK